jgi:L-threonylcarbamoyladenylate synthase
VTLLQGDSQGCAWAAAHLRHGGVVALPTETVYGLAGDATSPESVAAIFAAKGRPHFNPLIAHVLGVDAALCEAQLTPAALKLAEAFWPGPLTLVGPRSDTGAVCDLACAGLRSIAVRAPAHPVMRAILSELQRPLAAPSANRSGRISPTTAAAALEEFNGSVPVIDGGACVHGLESTIVACPVVGPPQLLRPGAITREDIEALIGPLAAAPEGAVSAPGMLSSHYAPKARMRLNATTKGDGEILIGFGPVAGDMTLSSVGDLTEAASRLYTLLRWADAANPTQIAVAPVPAAGLGEAINDRLRRAAAPR